MNFTAQLCVSKVLALRFFYYFLKISSGLCSLRVKNSHAPNNYSKHNNNNNKNNNNNRVCVFVFSWNQPCGLVVAAHLSV